MKTYCDTNFFAFMFSLLLSREGIIYYQIAVRFVVSFLILISNIASSNRDIHVESKVLHLPNNFRFHFEFSLTETTLEYATMSEISNGATFRLNFELDKVLDQYTEYIHQIIWCLLSRHFSSFSRWSLRWRRFFSSSKCVWVNHWLNHHTNNFSFLLLNFFYYCTPFFFMCVFKIFCELEVWWCHVFYVMFQVTVLKSQAYYLCSENS